MAAGGLSSVERVPSSCSGDALPFLDCGAAAMVGSRALPPPLYSSSDPHKHRDRERREGGGNAPPALISPLFFSLFGPLACTSSPLFLLSFLIR